MTSAYALVLVTGLRKGEALGLTIGRQLQRVRGQLLRRDTDLLGRLRQEFSSPAGVAGVELPPARSREESNDDSLLPLRVGELPADAG